MDLEVLLRRIAWQTRALVPYNVLKRAKILFRRMQSNKRAKSRRFTPLISKQLLHDQLAEAGVKEGDLIMVHSSLSRIGKVDGGPLSVVYALINAIGPSGTVVMPAYSSADDYIERLKVGDMLDLRNEPSITGAITEVFRQLPSTIRSSHPFSSILAYGPAAKYLTSGHANHEKICHSDSPLARFLELNGKILGLGVDLGPVSFYHVLDDTWDEFPFSPYSSPFEGRYIDHEGKLVQRLLLRYDRKLSKSRIDQPFGVNIRQWLTARFERKDILHRFVFGAAQSWQMEARPLFQELQELCHQGITIYTADTAKMKKVGSM